MNPLFQIGAHLEVNESGYIFLIRLEKMRYVDIMRDVFENAINSDNLATNPELLERIKKEREISISHRNPP